MDTYSYFSSWQIIISEWERFRLPSPLALILMDTSYLRNLKWSFLVRKYFEGLHSMVKIKMTLVKRHLMIHLLLNCTQAHMKGGGTSPFAPHWDLWANVNVRCGRKQKSLPSSAKGVYPLKSSAKGVYPLKSSFSSKFT